ncbi:MAG: hypothetical protein ACKOQ3_03450 [Novosphingobium sp.]
MASVEFYIGKNELEPDFVGDFEFLPRVGEYISRDRDGYFKYFQVKEIWFRSKGETDTYQTCVRVELDD